MSNNSLCMWTSTYPFVQNDVFFKVPYVLWIWDFVDMCLIHLGTRIWSPSIHTYFKKMDFLALKTLLYPLSIRKKLFFSTLNLVILQTIWNECVRFGGYKFATRSYSWKYKRKPRLSLWTFFGKITSERCRPDACLQPPSTGWSRRTADVRGEP
jgi:hypothetical protein